MTIVLGAVLGAALAVAVTAAALCAVGAWLRLHRRKVWLGECTSTAS